MDVMESVRLLIYSGQGERENLLLGREQEKISIEKLRKRIEPWLTARAGLMLCHTFALLYLPVFLQTIMCDKEGLECFF